MLVVTFVAIFAIGAQLRIDTDVWWHLRAGARTLSDGFIRQDSFSFTKAGEPWIDHSWGAEVISYLFWSVGGYGALELLTAAFALVGGVLVYRMCSGGTYLRCVAVGAASITASVFWAPRPQMFSYALTAVVLYVLFLVRHRGVDILWLLPLIMLVWANLHGGFAIGLILIAVTLGGELLERVLPLDERGHLETRTVGSLALVGAISLGAVCLNPYGPRLLSVPLQTAGGTFARLIEEWAPPEIHRASFWPFAAMVAILFLSVGASPRRLGWSDGLLCTTVTLLAFSAGRNISTFAVVVTPVITYHLAAVFAERGIALRPLRRASSPLVALNVAIIVFIVGFAAHRVSVSFRDATFTASQRQTLPVEAVAYLREHGVRGNLFNSYDWGGYLIHELPEVPVFVDGRSDLYGSDFLYDPYLFIAGGGPRFQDRLDRYKIETVLIHRTDGLASVLAVSPSWRSVYSDTLAIIFERRR